ncbi:glycerophosphodiester phosphodiesterase family protein [Cognatishimia sp. F0-27]|uniref:glycerophosphodiester phosphodiesterase family protein n=1 Tax=Cognatishimia sp. F0-27 TaxID=2816855 RepID=UPI001D0CC282|nr:glycerophosphodiester phosphodiesterase family protein [Cognatishimia sp. F0-27]MCC1491074.1 phosphodiesterase [Cognatishimia sp. F0-27]
MPALPAVFLERAIAHRAYHDLSAGRPENSRAAIRAAIGAGYGIEIDLQLSADGKAMVFHDYDLGRLTGARGAVRLRAAEDLGEIALLGGDEGIPTLSECLSIVGGAVPLLIELKDQDGAMGPAIGPLEADVALCLAGYDGPVAVMSFNPYSVARMQELLPEVPRGLTTSAFLAGDWPTVPADRRDALRAIPDFERVGASFISHAARDLDAQSVARVKAAGYPVLCWTIRSPEEERAARAIADQITFEGYAA